MRHYSYGHGHVDSKDRRIAELEKTVHELRFTIVEMSPGPLWHILGGFRDCKTTDEYREWRTRVIDEVIELADKTATDYGYERRAACPLCGSCSSSFYTSGFKLPTGMEIHLLGQRQSRMCRTMDAVFGLAREHMEPIVKAEELEKQRILAERRQVESLFLVHPEEDPVLLDERIYGDLRTRDELAVAERRLEDLGFTVIVEGRVRTYRLDQETFAVYADPRRKTEIQFYVHTFRRPRGTPHPGTFRLNDNRRRSAPDFRTLLAEMVAQMPLAKPRPVSAAVRSMR